MKMVTMQTLVILTLIGYGSVLCAEDTSARNDTWTEDIRHQNELFSQPFHHRNLTALGKVFSEGFTIMPPGMNTVVGGQAAEIPLFYAAVVFWQGVDNIVITSEEILPGSNTTAAERGLILLKKADGSVFMSLKFLTLCTGCRWRTKIYTAIWNLIGSFKGNT